MVSYNAYSFTNSECRFVRVNYICKLSVFRQMLSKVNTIFVFENHVLWSRFCLVEYYKLSREKSEFHVQRKHFKKMHSVNFQYEESPSSCPDYKIPLKVHSRDAGLYERMLTLILWIFDGHSRVLSTVALYILCRKESLLFYVFMLNYH